MKKLLAIVLALLVCAGLSGCAVEKIAPVSAVVPEVIDPEPEWNEEEVDAQIPDEYLYADDDEGDWDYDGEDDWDYSDEDFDDEDFDDEDYDEEVDYGISRTLTPAADGTMVDGNPVDYIISDDMFSSQMDEIAYFSDEYVGKSFSVTGYVILPYDEDEKNGFAVVRDYQEPLSDDEDEEDVGEYMTAEEFAALIDSLGEAEIEVDEGVEAVESADPAETPQPVETSASFEGTMVESGDSVSFNAQATPAPEPASPAGNVDPVTTATPEPIGVDQLADLAQSLLATVAPELDARIDDAPDLEFADAEDSSVDEEDAHDEDEYDEDGHVHAIYPVGIDCYYEGAIPEEDAWVRVVGVLEEYEYYDSEAQESFPALRLHAQSVTILPESEGGPRLVTQ